MSIFLHIYINNLIGTLWCFSWSFTTNLIPCSNPFNTKWFPTGRFWHYWWYLSIDRGRGHKGAVSYCIFLDCSCFFQVSFSFSLLSSEFWYKYLSIIALWCFVVRLKSDMIWFWQLKRKSYISLAWQINPYWCCFQNEIRRTESSLHNLWFVHSVF